MNFSSLPYSIPPAGFGCSPEEEKRRGVISVGYSVYG